MRTSLILVALLLACAGKPTEDPTPTGPVPLNEATLVQLRAKMGRHGARIEAIAVAAPALDYEVLEQKARSIADAERIARPGDPLALESRLPDSFYEHQDALRTHALGLADLAADHAPAEQIQAAVGRMAVSCAGCHYDHRWRR